MGERRRRRGGAGAGGRGAGAGAGAGAGGRHHNLLHSSTRDPLSLGRGNICRKSLSSQPPPPPPPPPLLLPPPSPAPVPLLTARKEILVASRQVDV
eukprot:765965-Hanusia_phi.AAC.1